MDNYEKLQFAARQISKMIRLEQAWREGQMEIEGETVVFDATLKTKLKQKFAALRTECIAALNGVIP